MELEQLTKSQIVLLTLLVSFVTSIATGIVTVSLMDQAPPVVAQTVNRVVEHTVETIVPATSGKNQGAAVGMTQEKTIVVTPAEQVAEAVAKASPAVVRLTASNNSDTPAVLGLGVVVSATGLIVADSASLGESADATIALSDGTSARAFVVKRDSADGLVLLQAATTSADKPITWTAASFSSGKLALGTSLVMITGKSVTRVATGIVSAMIGSDSTTIDTSLPTDQIVAGAPVVDLSGAVTGISTSASRSLSGNAFVPASAVGALVTQKSN